MLLRKTKTESLHPPPASINIPTFLDAMRRSDNATLERLYREYRPRIIKQIVGQGGTEAEAKDIFQDALTAIYLKAQQADFQINNSFFTYLYAICQNLWLKKFRSKTGRSTVSFDSVPVLTDDCDAQQVLEHYERHCFFMKKFSELGEKCREVLRLSIVEEKSAEQMVELLNFSNLRYFYKRKSECKDKFIDLVRKDPEFKQHRP